MVWDLTKNALAIKEGYDIVKNSGVFSFLARMFGWKMGQANDKKGSGDAAGPKGPDIITENQSQEGELYALLSWIVLLDQGRAINYQMVDDDGELFPLIAAALPTGATKALLQTIAVEVVTMTSKKVTGYTYPKDPKAKPGDQPKQVPIHSEWQERINLKGPQIVSALTWFAKSQTGATNEEKARKVAAHLESFHIFDNLRDGAALATKKIGQLWSGFKVRLGITDTNSYEGLAAYALKSYPGAFDRIMQNPERIRMKQAIEATPDATEKRKLQEDYQDWLGKQVTSYINDPDVRDGMESRRNHGPTNAEKDRRIWRFVYIFGTIVIVLSFGKMWFDANKTKISDYAQPIQPSK